MLKTASKSMHNWRRYPSSNWYEIDQKVVLNLALCCGAIWRHRENRNIVHPVVSLKLHTYRWLCKQYFALWLHAGWLNKLCGRLPQYAPLPAAMEACSGSLETGRPSQARWDNTHHPIPSRPPMPPADQMYATDVVRQTSDRQTSDRLMPPRGRGYNNCLSVDEDIHKLQWRQKLVTYIEQLSTMDVSFH